MANNLRVWIAIYSVLLRGQRYTCVYFPMGNRIARNSILAFVDSKLAHRPNVQVRLQGVVGRQNLSDISLEESQQPCDFILIHGRWGEQLMDHLRGNVPATFLMVQKFNRTMIVGSIEEIPLFPRLIT
jgi:hypothetical protein